MQHVGTKVRRRRYRADEVMTAKEGVSGVRSFCEAEVDNLLGFFSRIFNYGTTSV